MNPPSEFVLLTTPHMHDLGNEICARIKTRGVDLPHYHVPVKRFKNGETLASIDHTIRRQHIFFMPELTLPDPNNAFMTMLIANDAIMRASASSITLVTPFLPYLRQDRKDKPRVPITARLMANLIQSNPIVRGLITLDMHAEQEQGFFNLPVDNLTGVRIFETDILERFGPDLSNLVVLAPDIGGSVRNNRLAQGLAELRKDIPLKEIPVSIGRKHRPTDNIAETLGIIGDGLEDKRVIIHEDMVDTGGTAIGTIEKVFSMGAKEVWLYATHGIFSAEAVANFKAKNIKVVSTNSIPRKPEFYAENPWLTMVTLAPYFADAMFEAMLIGAASVSLLNTRVFKTLQL